MLNYVVDWAIQAHGAGGRHDGFRPRPHRRERAHDAHRRRARRSPSQSDRQDGAGKVQATRLVRVVLAQAGPIVKASIRMDPPCCTAMRECRGAPGARSDPPRGRRVNQQLLSRGMNMATSSSLFDSEAATSPIVTGSSRGIGRVDRRTAGRARREGRRDRAASSMRAKKSCSRDPQQGRRSVRARVQHRPQGRPAGPGERSDPEMGRHRHARLQRRGESVLRHRAQHAGRSVRQGHG